MLIPHDKYEVDLRYLNYPFRRRGSVTITSQHFFDITKSAECIGFIKRKEHWVSFSVNQGFRPFCKLIIT